MTSTCRETGVSSLNLGPQGMPAGPSFVTRFRRVCHAILAENLQSRSTNHLASLCNAQSSPPRSLIGIARAGS